jgi:hypothetical protein
MQKKIESLSVARFFCGTTYQIGKNILNEPKIYVPNERKIYQMAVKQTKGSQIYLPTLSISRFSRNSDFGFENKPSGNLGFSLTISSSFSRR